MMFKRNIVIPASVLAIIVIGVSAPSIIGYSAYDPSASIIDDENGALCSKFGMNAEKTMSDCKADLQDLRQHDRLTRF